MKRVYCLYRVSTKGQVDKDDIPMQKTSCREFAERNGWTILKEFQEKGVSGFKVSASDRDAIQDLKSAAEKKEFDEEQKDDNESLFYTNMILDGRMITVGENKWDLRTRHRFEEVHIDMNDIYNEDE